MKKTFLLAVLLLCASLSLKAQSTSDYLPLDCDEVVLARYHYNAGVLDNIPAEKRQAICNTSRAAFSFCDSLPAGNVVVRDIYDLYDKKYDTQVNTSYTDDMEFCSYYRYNYMQHQMEVGKENDIYFRLHNGTHQYLRLRNYPECVRLSLEMSQENKD